MNDVAQLLRSQIGADLRALPQKGMRRLAGARDVSNYGTVAEVRDAARRALPPVIFDFVDGAANDEHTALRNLEDLAALAIVPRVLVDTSTVDCSTTVLGQEIRSPIIGAPTGLCGLVHHDGELAIARALHSAGSIYILAAMASYSIEEVAAATSGPTWFQTYLWRDRGLVKSLLERAQSARMDTLVVTVDVPQAAARDRDRRNGFGLPPRATLRSVAGAVTRPRWAWDLVRRPRLTAASVAGSMSSPTGSVSIAAYVNEQFDPSATWTDLAWFRKEWSGHLVVKGVLRAEDAKQAVEIGADAVVVSNHGGRQLDYAPSSISALPGIVDAVGQDAEIYLDGGIRRGSDVLKALALGARACLVGRSVVFGLGVGAERGVSRVLDILTDELRAAMTLAGRPSVRGLEPGLVVAPARTTPRERHAL